MTWRSHQNFHTTPVLLWNPTQISQANSFGCLVELHCHYAGVGKNEKKINKSRAMWIWMFWQRNGKQSGTKLLPFVYCSDTWKRITRVGGMTAGTCPISPSRSPLCPLLHTLPPLWPSNARGGRLFYESFSSPAYSVCFMAAIFSFATVKI